METILSRIQKLATEEGITIGALERRIGASKGVLSRAINNGTDIQSKWIQTLVENYPQYSADWLLSGRGEMKQNTSTHAEIKGSPITSTDKDMVDKLLSIIQEKDKTIREQAEEIGQLRERIDHITKRRGADASDVPTSGIANVG